MRIQRPTITQIAEIKGDGAILTGSFSGSFTGEYNTAILSSSGQIADLGAGIISSSTQIDTDLFDIDGLVSGSIQIAGDISGSLGANATLIRTLTAAGVSGSLGANATLIRSLDAATISGSNNADSASASTRLTTAEAFKTSFDTAIGLSSDDVTILGDLTVQGTRTELQVANLNVEDLNITVASGSADSAAANGAGLTVDGASATLTYASTGDKWVFNKVVDVPTSGILINGTAVTSTAAELNQLDDNTVGGTTAGDIVTIDGTQTLSNKTIAASQVTEISNLTADEGAQLENIGTTTISATQWGYLGASNQGITTTSDVQFDSFGVGTAASGTTGEIRATGDITAYYSSDERLKENFAPLTGALDKVKAIGGYEFDWKDGIEDVVSKTGHDIGVKAQELQAQYPELVHERDNGYLAVDYIKLNAVLIEAVKELAAKVEELSK